MKFDLKFTVAPPDGEVVCDFCSGPEIFKTYDCEDFVTSAIQVEPHAASQHPRMRVVHNSRGGWAACKICAELIDQDRWDDLAERSLATLLLSEPSLAPFKHEVLIHLRRMHQEFRQLKKRPN